MDAIRKLRLRGVAANEEYALDNYGQDEAVAAMSRVRTAREELGDLSDEDQAVIDSARAEYRVEAAR